MAQRDNRCSCKKNERTFLCQTVSSSWVLGAFWVYYKMGILKLITQSGFGFFKLLRAPRSQFFVYKLGPETARLLGRGMFCTVSSLNMRSMPAAEMQKDVTCLAAFHGGTSFPSICNPRGHARMTAARLPLAWLKTRFLLMTPLCMVLTKNFTQQTS